MPKRDSYSSLISETMCLKIDSSSSHLTSMEKETEEAYLPYVDLIFLGYIIVGTYDREMA